MLVGLLIAVIWNNKNSEIPAARKPDRYDALREMNKDSEKTGVATYEMPDGTLLTIIRKRMLKDVRYSVDHVDRIINQRIRTSLADRPEMVPAYLDIAVKHGSYLLDAELTEKLKALHSPIYTTTSLGFRHGFLDPNYIQGIRDRLDIIETLDRMKQPQGSN